MANIIYIKLNIEKWKDGLPGAKCGMAGKEGLENNCEPELGIFTRRYSILDLWEFNINYLLIIVII